MDLSPETLREVEFREQWRGYSPDAVDDFLERVAVAVAELQEQFGAATERAAQAERRLLESVASEDELRRTLVLAQRTADAARKEAAEEAARLIDAAREEADRVVREATERARLLDEDARKEAREELQSLQAARQALRADVDSLQGYLDQERGRLRAELERLVEQLAADGPLVPPEPPELSEPAVPEPPGAADEGAAVEPEARVVAEEGEPTAAHPAPTAELEPLTDEERLDEQQPDEAQPDEAQADEGQLDEGQLDERDAAPEVDIVDDDPFLAELRRAVNDPEPLGPRDHERGGEGASTEPAGPRADQRGRAGDEAAEEPVELYDQDLAPSSRFRLRRRR